MDTLLPDETMLRGRWLPTKSGIRPDATTRRIKRLIDNPLVKVAADESGWSTLYRDANDGRLWELTYPDSDMQGGGPPQLRCIDRKSAVLKYGKVA
jgi:hypothetical protein